MNLLGATEQVLKLIITQKHKLYQSAYMTLILLKTRNTHQESSKDAWPILQSKFNSRE